MEAPCSSEPAAHASPPMLPSEASSQPPPVNDAHHSPPSSAEAASASEEPMAVLTSSAGEQQRPSSSGDDRDYLSSTSLLHALGFPRRLPRPLRAEDHSASGLLETAPFALKPAPVVETPSEGEVDRWGDPMPPVPVIQRWDELPCVALLNELYAQKKLRDPDHDLLFQNCKWMWRIGYEIRYKKKLNLPRAQRHARILGYCDNIHRCAHAFNMIMLRRIQRAWDASARLPTLDDVTYQELEPKLAEWRAALDKFYRPAATETSFFGDLLKLYDDNYKVMYARHREVPDYGFSRILPATHKPWYALLRLKMYAKEAYEIGCEFERHFADALARCDQDRARQKRDTDEWLALPLVQRQSIFEDYMRHSNQDFYNWVEERRDTTNPLPEQKYEMYMSFFQHHFNGLLRYAIQHKAFSIRLDGMGHARAVWTLDKSREKQDALNATKSWRLDKLKDQQDARDVAKEWAHALGRDPDTFDEDWTCDHLWKDGPSNFEMWQLENDYDRWLKQASRASQAGLQSLGHPAASGVQQSSMGLQPGEMQASPRQKLQGEDEHAVLTPPQFQDCYLHQYCPPGQCQHIPVPWPPPARLELTDHASVIRCLEEVDEWLKEDDAPQQQAAVVQNATTTSTSINDLAESGIGLQHGATQAETVAASQDTTGTAGPSHSFGQSQQTGEGDGTQQRSATALAGTSTAPTIAPTNNPPIHLSKSFAAVEDDLLLRARHRATTVPDICSSTTEIAGADNPSPDVAFKGRATKTSRHGMQVPRIFTGSFSQLESDIHAMQLHKVSIPEEQPDLSPGHNFKVRDFAVTPQPSPSPTPSPVSLLYRREALLSKETEIQDRVIRGEVVRSRRPSTKARAQTLNDTTGGLEAWLAEGESSQPTQLSRPERKNTM